MAYNTGNDSGSSSPKDLIDNSEDLDILMTGAGTSNPNRLGVPLKSWKGMEGEFDEAQAQRAADYAASEANRGYENPVPYAADIAFTRVTQLVQYNNELYKATPGTLPWTTSGTWATDYLKLASVGDYALRQDLMADGDQRIVGTQPFVGSVSMTQHEKNAQTIHINDISPTPANTWLSRAIDATPAGWTLQLGLGPYQAKFSKTRSNIRIVGQSKPRPNAGKTALVDGTVVQGTLRLTGSNISIGLLGVDSGSAACTLLNSGSPMDALVLNDTARSPLYNCRVHNAVGLLQNADAPAHNFLLEGCVDSDFNDLTSYLGQWGTVLKAENTTASGIKSYGCTQAGLAIKSDSGASGTPCRKTSVTGVKIYADGQSCAAGILVYAATSSMDNITVSDYHVEGCSSNLKLACDTRAANVNLLDGVSFDSGTLTEGVLLGIDTFGAVRNVKIANTIVKNTASGKSIQVEANSLGVDLVNVTASSPTGVNNIDNVYLAGRYTFDNLTSCVDGDYGTPAGIDCYIESQAVSRIGAYIGKLAVAGAYVSIPLINGWTQYFSTITAKAINGRTQLFGRAAVPATPWTGKAQIGTVPPSIAPLTNKYFLVLGYDTANKPFPVSLRVGPAGGIFIDDIVIAAAFPATIAWVGLEGVSWLLAE